MIFRLKIFSKDKKVLQNFLIFFLILNKTSSTWKIISNLNSRRVITVLKSPHVNKTAQEQFEYRTYCKEIVISSVKPGKLLFTLKKIKSYSFPGIFLKLTSLSDKSFFFNSNLNVFNPFNIKFETKKINNRTSSHFLRLLDCYGEILVKKKYFDRLN